MKWIIWIILGIVTELSADCIWFDKCGDDPDYNDGAHELNCVYNGPAGMF